MTPATRPSSPAGAVSSVSRVLEVGARPVFADIDPVTRNLDLEKVEAAITPKTRAILPVDLAGLPVDRDAVADRMLDRIAQRYAALHGSPGAARSLATEYRRNLSTIGQAVRVDLVGETLTGDALDIDEDGHLLVNIGACIRTVAAGDVVHLR